MEVEENLGKDNDILKMIQRSLSKGDLGLKSVAAWVDKVGFSCMLAGDMDPIAPEPGYPSSASHFPLGPCCWLDIQSGNHCKGFLHCVRLGQSPAHLPGRVWEP